MHPQSTPPKIEKGEKKKKKKKSKTQCTITHNNSNKTKTQDLTIQGIEEGTYTRETKQETYKDYQICTQPISGGGNKKQNPLT
jgi:hypothetical protein